VTAPPFLKARRSLFPLKRKRKNPSRPGGGHGKPLSFRFASGGWGYPPDHGGTETPGDTRFLGHRPGTPGILKYVIRCGSFLRKGIELYCVVVLNYLFGVPKIVNFVKMTLFAKKPGWGKVTCVSGTDNEFPQEFRTVRFKSLNGAKAFPFQLNVRYSP
jgi:hypothetical protein